MTGSPASCEKGVIFFKLKGLKMSLNRWAKRRDKNEPEIVDFLRKSGATVELIDKPCDLIIGYRGHNILAEVKTDVGKLNKSQIEFFDTWKGRVFILRTTTAAHELLKLYSFDRVVTDQQEIIKQMEETFEEK